MEGTHGQLGAGLADGLSGDDADRLTDLDALAVGHVGAVAACADAHMGAAGHDGADLQLGDAGVDDLLGVKHIHHLILADEQLTRGGIVHIMQGVTAVQTLLEALDNGVALADLADPDALGRVAVLLADDDLLRDIDQTAGQITGVRSTQSGIGQTLTGASRGDEVFQNIQAFTVVGADRHFQRLAGRVGQQAAHTGQLLDLVHRTTGTGIGHHIDGVALVVLLQVVAQSIGDFLGGGLPDLNGLAVALLIGDQAAVEVLHDLLDLLIGSSQNSGLLLGHDSIGDSDRDGGQGGVLVALCLDLVQHHGAGLGAVLGQAAADDVGQALLRQLVALAAGSDLQCAGVHLVVELRGRIGTVDIAQILRDRVVEDDLAHRGIDQTGLLHAVKGHGAAHLDGCLQGDQTLGVRHHGLGLIAEDLAVALILRVDEGQVVAAQNHILRGHGDGLAVRGLQQVAGGQHQHLGLALGLGGQRQMDSHLVAVKVSVEGGADQRVQLDGATLDQNRLERLNAQTVQRRRTVQQDGVALDDGLERIPDLGAGTLDHLAGGLDVVGLLLLDQVLHDEGLEQLEGHLLGQAALIHLQLGADNDNGTAGVVNTLAQQVLAETTLLALEHIGQGLQRTVVRTGDRAAAAAVVDQGVHSLLQHTLLVADDDVGGTQLQQTLQTVVAVDDAAVQIVQVGGRKAAAVQLQQGAQIRRNDGDDRHNHPLGALVALEEALNALQTLEQTHALLAVGMLKLLAQLLAEFVEVDLGQQLLDRLSAHAGFKRILVLFAHLLVLTLGQQLLFLQWGEAWVSDNVVGEIQDLVQLTGADVQHQADAAGNALEIPDVRDWCSQLDVAHALTADLGAGDLDAALVANLTLVADALVLAAVAFPVLGRSKNALAVQAVALRLQGAVVDGFGLGDLAVAPGTDLVRGGKADLNRIEFFIFHSANPLKFNMTHDTLDQFDQSSKESDSIAARSSAVGPASSSRSSSKPSSASLTL